MIKNSNKRSKPDQNGGILDAALKSDDAASGGNISVGAEHPRRSGRLAALVSPSPDAHCSPPSNHPVRKRNKQAKKSKVSPHHDVIPNCVTSVEVGVRSNVVDGQDEEDLKPAAKPTEATMNSRTRVAKKESSSPYLNKRCRRSAATSSMHEIDADVLMELPPELRATILAEVESSSSAAAAMEDPSLTGRGLSSFHVDEMDSDGSSYTSTDAKCYEEIGDDVLKAKEWNLAQKIKQKRTQSAQSDPTSVSIGGSTCIVINNVTSDSATKAGKPDGRGGLYKQIFTAEYSKTSRATCRRCDEKIVKGELRVAHQPLFRGKPGYMVYRHLQCAVFDASVQVAEDVDGYSDLEPEDFVKLAARVEESKVELKQESESVRPDELVAKMFDGTIRKPPPGLMATLLPFQTEGVSWMYSQEMNDKVKGGILADEMGMGKTLQTIVCILDNRPKLQHCPNSSRKLTADLAKEENLWKAVSADWKLEMEKSNVPLKLQPKDGSMRAGTLVICPVIALEQWQSEIDRFTDGSLNVCIYHGPNRSSAMPRELLSKYDVVLTTYQVIEADFRKMASPNKVKCPNCGKKYKIDKLKIHLKYYCGEGAERTEAQARQQRASERGGHNQRRGDRGNSEKNMMKKKSSTISKTTGKNRMSKKKVIVKSNDGMDSESELSVVSTESSMDHYLAATPTARISRSSSRTAAVAATKKLALSSKKWSSNNEGVNDDEESFHGGTLSDSEDSLSCDDRKMPARRNLVVATKKKGMQSKKRKGKMSAKSKANRSRGNSYSSDAEYDSSDDDLSDAAIEKQREAFEAARAKSSKARRREKKRISKNEAKGRKKKKISFNGGGNEGSDHDDANADDDSSDDEEIQIDMDKLIRDAQINSCMSVLHSFCWWRIVLDEAHMIKRRSTQTAAAAFALIGVSRWCLSGTPLQNRVGEFYSLIRFLRIDPMAHYYCRAKDCTCKSLHYRMFNGKCQDCGHSSVQHYSHFNKYVLNPIKSSGYSGDGRRAMFVLKEQVLDKCLLRRTKETKADDLKLPNRMVKIRTVSLHPVEEDFYNTLYTQSQTAFNDYVASGTLLNNYAHIFDLLIRMRQAVDHPYLVLYSKKGLDGAVGVTENGGQLVSNGSIVCDICSEEPTDRVESSCCSAAFCRSCVMDYVATAQGLGNSENGVPCPSCRSPFSVDLSSKAPSTPLSDAEEKKSSKTYNEGMPLLKELSHIPSGSILRRINLAEFATSTKIEALTEELVEMRRTSPGSKAIVFSQFVNMLDLIRWRLHSDPCLSDLGLGVASLHGGMNVSVREQNIRSFKEDHDVRVLLVSLKAGGVALNLTVANYIYLMDPWWNPAAEMQAIDRTHRLGQYRPIRAVRFIAENTVEERILQLQEKKRLVFDGTVGRDAGSLQMLSVTDMKCLFS